MEETMLSGDELEKALLEGDLTPAQVHLTGMVRKSEKEGYISFSKYGCDAWIDVPIGMIKKANHIGYIHCKEHIYPRMKITLNEPKNSEGKVLLSLLAHVSRPHMSIPTQTQAKSTYQQSSAFGGGTPQTPVISKLRAPSFGNRFGAFGGGWGIFPGHNPCCCNYEAEICMGGYCWPVTYEACVSCPFGDWCECSDAGPNCTPSPIV